MASPEISPEYKTIKEHTATLISAIISSEPIADHLFSKNIITMEVCESVGSGANKADKNRKLIFALLNHVKVSTQGFQVFLDALTDQQVYGKLIEKLQSTYAKHKPEQQLTSNDHRQPVVSTEHKVVYAELRDLTTKLEDVINWKQFGLNIGIHPSRIQIIEADRRGVDDCKLHLFLEWTKKEKPTWNKVIQALVDMRMEVLAKTLGAQYGLPVPPSST